VIRTASDDGIPIRIELNLFFGGEVSSHSNTYRRLMGEMLAASMMAPPWPTTASIAAVVTRSISAVANVVSIG
jgi:hypothetical protein